MSELQQPQGGRVPELTQGWRMRLALADAAVSVGDMADYMGVTRETVGRWLHDRSPVKRSTLRLWALRTGVSLVWLETGEAPAPLEVPGPRMELPRLDSNQQPSGYPLHLVRNAA